MRLFVWHGDGVLTDYTDGQIVAIAEDLNKAKELVIKKDCAVDFGYNVRVEPYVVDLGDECPAIPAAWVTWGGG